MRIHKIFTMVQSKIFKKMFFYDNWWTKKLKLGIIPSICIRGALPPHPPTREWWWYCRLLFLFYNFGYFPFFGTRVIGGTLFLKKKMENTPIRRKGKVVDNIIITHGSGGTGGRAPHSQMLGIIPSLSRKKTFFFKSYFEQQ